jgi:hypothetical protein
MSKTVGLIAAIFLSLAAGLIVADAPVLGSESDKTERWVIRGALSEACSCNVPCTCNFGEGPSPHPYCYVAYCYDIKQGNFDGVKLDGLRFGATEGVRGNVLYLDSRAQGERRKALEALARKVMRINGDRMGRSKLLGISYVDIKQVYDDRHDELDLGGFGGFKTNYIMGRDKSKPVSVLNNTEWPLHEVIKGKTEYLRINDAYGDRHSFSKTNSNHGDFEFDEKTKFGDLSCSGSCDADPAHKKHDH